MIRLISLCLLCFQIQAGTFYVDGVNGNNSNDGSTGSPWLTLGKAVTTLAASDTLRIRPATYAEYPDFTQHGLTIEADGWAAGTIDLTVIAWGIKLTGTNCIVRGFKLIGNTSIGFQGVMHNVTGGNQWYDMEVNDSPAFNYGFYAETVLGCRLERSNFINTKNHAINITGCWTVGADDGHYLRSNKLSTVYGADAFRVMSSNTRIISNLVTNWGSILIENGSVLQVGFNYFFVTTVADADFSNVGAGPGPYTTGEGNGFTATGPAGGTVTPTSWGSGAGATLLNSNHPDMIQGFTQGAGAAPDRTSTNVTWSGNSFVGGIRCQVGILEGQEMDDRLSDWTFENNVFVDIEYPFHNYVPYVKWFNNLFIRCAYGLGGTVIYLYPNTPGKGVGDNHDLRNNIFFECGDNPASATKGWYGVVAGVTNIVANYNLVVGTGAGTTKTGYTDDGLEANGINGSDPLFVNEGAYDFNLQSGSPARNTGTDLSAYFTTDFNGVTRVAWDIGPFEFEGAGPTIGVTFSGRTVRSGVTVSQ